MKISSAYPSKYLKAADLDDQERLVTIKGIQIEEVGSNEHKPVLYFNEEQKGMVLNKTNSKVIAKTYGDETEGWPGKKVVMYPAMVDLRGDMVEAIRLRIPKKPGTVQTAAHHSESNPPPQDDDSIPF